jgi:mannan endo-1,4-beta-mannosidase
MICEGDYNSTWGNTWIEQHDKAGKEACKPVVLEEYGSPNSPHAAITAPWQQTVLKTNIAYDSFWQFGTGLSNGQSPSDQYSIYTGTIDYLLLVEQHAKDMLAKCP